VVSETDKAYAAGLFDGEGSVSVGYKKAATKSTKITYQVSAVLAMVDEPSILWLASVFGGYIDTTSRPKTERPIYRWKLYG
jgi:hypothetical protein